MNNFGMVVRKPGRQASRMEQILLSPVILDVLGFGDRVVLHHITENTAYKLQVEVEVYTQNAVSFHRVNL